MSSSCLATILHLSRPSFKAPSWYMHRTIDECHIYIGFSGYLGFIFCGLICINLQFMHIFPDYARFWFVERLLQICIIQAKILGEMFEMNPS